MSDNCKVDTSPTVFSAEYHIIKSEYDNLIYMYTDASKRREPVAASAVTEQEESKCRLPDYATAFTAKLK